MTSPGYTEVPKGAMLEIPRAEPPPSLVADDRPLREIFRANWAEIPEEKRSATTLIEAAEAGLQYSVSGILARKDAPEIYLPEDAGWANRAMYQVGSISGDFPFMAAGAFLGAAGGGGLFSLATGAGGALALPAGIRRVMLEKYENGEIDSFARFWDVLVGSVTDEFKAWVLGASTAVAGYYAGLSPILPNTLKFASEVSTLATVGSLLEGEVPEPKDFTDAAIVVGGLRGARYTSAKLGNTYIRTGKNTYEILQDAESDPSIVEDLNSVNQEIPRSYQGLPEAQKTAPEIPKLAEPKERAIAEGEGETPYDRLRKHISRDQPDPKRPWTFNDFYTRWVDKKHPLRVVRDAMVKSIDENMSPEEALKITEDPYRLARLKPGMTARATHFIDYAPVDYDTLQPVGRPLRQILGSLEDGERFDTYASARRAVELHKRGIKTPFDDADARVFVEETKDQIADPKTGMTYEQIRLEQREFERAGLRYLLQSGVISQEKFLLLEAAGENYVPFHRVFEKALPKGKGARGMTTRDPIMRILGSERDVISPMETIIKNTYMLVDLAENNRIGKALVQLSELAPGGENFAKKMKTRVRKVTMTDKEKQRILKKFLIEQEDLTEEEAMGASEIMEEEFSVFRPQALRPKADEILVYREGRAERWRVDERVAEAFQGASRNELDAMIRFFGAPARMLRAGAIFTPEFMARNPVRDQFMAYLNSDSGYHFVQDWFNGIASIAKEDEILQAYMRSGAPMAEIVALDRTHNQRHVKDLMRSRLHRNVRNGLRNPIEGLRMLSSLSEAGTRVGAFKRAMRGKELTAENIMEAGLEAREISLDFGRIGTRAEAVNRIIPFFNAQIQGIDKLARIMKEHPARTSSRLMVSIVLPSVLLYLHNKDIDGWDRIPRWQKDFFWLVPVDGDNLRGVAEFAKVRVGDRVWLRIPKPFEPGIIFGSGTERILEAMIGKNPHAFDEFGNTMLRGASPGFVPTAVAPIIETFANRSLFLDRPLVPSRREGLLPQYQYQPYTTELTKAIGKLVSSLPVAGKSPAASPIVIENFVHAWSGGLGVHIMSLADASFRKAGVLPDPPRPADTLADLPLMKAFVVRYPSYGSETLSRFYERYRENQQILETIEGLKTDGEWGEYLKLLEAYGGKTIDLSEVQQAISSTASLIRQIHNNPDPKLGPEERAQVQEELLLYMMQVAEMGNEIFDAWERAQ